MTNEEALEIVQKCLEEGKLIPEAFDYSFFYTVEDALKKQIPKSPISNKCAACHCDVVGSGFYCWNCGQAIIDWSWEV